jgi:hypothetical protein
MKREGASLPEGPDDFIVASPADAKVQTIVRIFDPEAVADELEPVGGRKWIFSLVGKVNDGRSEH